MTKFLLLSIIGVLLFQANYAQNRLNGRVYENKTKVPIGGIKIENLKTHATALSDSTGQFSIKASVGDYVSFSGFSYEADTVYLANLKNLSVYLYFKHNMLREVKVITPQLNLGTLTAPVAPGPFGGHTLVYQTDSNGNYKGGLAINIFDSNADKKRKEKDEKIEGEEEKELQISKTFSPKNLETYLPISGIEIDNFIILYRPDIETYYSSSFNLTAYLSECYKKFLTYPIDERKSKTYFQLDAKKN